MSKYEPELLMEILWSLNLSSKYFKALDAGKKQHEKDSVIETDNFLANLTAIS